MMDDEGTIGEYCNMNDTNRHKQIHIQSHLTRYTTNHCLLTAHPFSPLMNNTYNFNLYIKGTCSCSIDCPLYTDLTVLFHEHLSSTSFLWWDPGQSSFIFCVLLCFLFFIFFELCVKPLVPVHIGCSFMIATAVFYDVYHSSSQRRIIDQTTTTASSNIVVMFFLVMDITEI